MNFNSDIFSKLANQVFNTLLLNSPYDTCIGFIVGIVLDGFLPVLYPVIQRYAGLDLHIIELWHWIALGVLLMNVKNISRKSHISAEAKAAFDLIREARKLGLSDLEIKQKYRYTVEKFTSNIGLSREAQKEIELAKSIKKRTRRNEKSSERW